MIQDGDTKCKGRVDVHVFSVLGTAQRRKRSRCNKRKPKPAGAATGIASSTLWCGQQWQLDALGIVHTARPYLCQVQLTGCNTLNCSKCTTCGVMQGVMSGVGQAAQLSCCEMIGDSSWSLPSATAARHVTERSSMVMAACNVAYRTLKPGATITPKTLPGAPTVPKPCHLWLQTHLPHSLSLQAPGWTQAAAAAQGETRCPHLQLQGLL
jgi:hypothetical protein